MPPALHRILHQIKLPRPQHPAHTLRLHRPRHPRALTTTHPAGMPEYKLSSADPSALAEGQSQEVAVDGLGTGDDATKVLLLRSGGKLHATGPKCTHYGLPLAKGVVTGDGRLTCAFHGACFDVKTGDVEDAPALDPIAVFEVVERDGGVYIRGEEEEVRKGRRVLDVKCQVQEGEKVVVVGGGSGGLGVVEELRKLGFKGSITVVSSEGHQPYDRPKLSKALLSEIDKVAFRDVDFYKAAGILFVSDEVSEIDFSGKTVATKSGKSLDYTKLILATGGTAKSLPLPGLKKGELKNVFLLRNLADTAAIVEALGQDSPKKVVVVGASFIGMEVANCLAGQKHDVHVVGMEKEPCEAVFGTKVGAIFRALLEKNGITFHMSAQVDKATPDSQNDSAVGAVHLKDGTELPADVVIEGVGVGPETTYLRNNPAVALNKDGSVTVDASFALPGQPGVYAVGDIATYPYRGSNVRIEHWNVAQNAGRAVARTIMGRKAPPFVPIFWSALGMQLRYCGHPVGGYDDVVVKGKTDADGPAWAAFYVKGDEVVAVASMGMDPVMSKSAELMRRGRMPGAKEVEGGTDVLGVSLA